SPVVIGGTFTPNALGGGIGGSLTVNAVAGIATFSNLIFTSTGSFTLTATSTGLANARSTPLAIGPGPANTLFFATPPSSGAGAPGGISALGGSPQSTQVSRNFANPLVAIVRDSGGNPVPGVTVTFTAPSSGASGTFNGSTIATAITGVNGQATSPTLTANSI